MGMTSLSNYACLYTTDFQSHGKSNSYMSHLHYVHLYETLYLEMTAHFQKVTETGSSLKQVLLRYRYNQQSIYIYAYKCLCQCVGKVYNPNVDMLGPIISENDPPFFCSMGQFGPPILKKI